MNLRLLTTCLLTAALCGLAPVGYATEIYKTVDEQGRVIYSDRPSNRPGETGERVTLPPVNTLPPEQRQQSTQRARQQQVPTIEYQIRIVSPQDNADVPPGQRDLAIAASLNPPLHSEHLLLFMMNGEPIQETRDNSVVVREITRGAHTLHVEVIDAQGHTVSRSESITVNVHRPSVLRPTPN